MKLGDGWGIPVRFLVGQIQPDVSANPSLYLRDAFKIKREQPYHTGKIMLQTKHFFFNLYREFINVTATGQRTLPNVDWKFYIDWIEVIVIFLFLFKILLGKTLKLF